MTKSWIALTAGAASLVLSGLDSAQAQMKLNLRLDYSLYGTHAAFYLGIEKGLYKAEGIDLTIAEGSGSGTTARLLAQGTDPGLRHDGEGGWLGHADQGDPRRPPALADDDPQPRRCAGE